MTAPKKKPAARRLELMPLATLTERRAPRNPKLHDAGIRASIDHHGVVELITLDERTGNIVAGHGRLDAIHAARQAGETPPDGVDTDPAGEWLVPVVRGWASRSDADFESYLVGSNHLVELGGWNPRLQAEILAELDRETPDLLTLAGYTHDDVDQLLASLAADPPPTLPRPRRDADPDNVEGIQKPDHPVTQPGDLWQLGPHRLICGDSTQADTVDRLLDGAGVDLVLEDPPYAIYGSSTGIGADIADDRMVRPFFESILATSRRILPEFGHAYVHCDWRSYPALWEAARRAGLTMKNALVWDKGGSGLGSNYANTYELVAFLAKLPPPTAMKSGGRRGQRSVHRPNVFHYPRPAGAERLHNAAKPVALLEELITNSTDGGARIFDGFAGSGSTLIAAHRTGRTCLTADDDPGWCDVVAKRYQLAAGDYPVLVGQGPINFAADA